MVNSIENMSHGRVVSKIKQQIGILRTIWDCAFDLAHMMTFFDVWRSLRRIFQKSAPRTRIHAFCGLKELLEKGVLSYWEN